MDTVLKVAAAVEVSGIPCALGFQCRYGLRAAAQCPFMCRFLDAGITRGASCSGGRRPKSARARSRGKFGRRAGGRRYGDLIVAPVMMVGAKLARGDLDRVGSGAWKLAIGISVVAWSVSTGDRLVDSLIGVIVPREIAASVQPAHRRENVATLTDGLAH